MTRTAIILFNLGGPDNPAAVKPFLYNLFKDPAILRIPAPFRQMLAWVLSSRRAKIAGEIYAKIGGRSPILENTQAQARALEKLLGIETKCFVAMRYWNPFVSGAVAAVAEFAPEQIVLLPLYPQFSTTTTASSFRSFHRAMKRYGKKIDAKVKSVCCYPENEGFIHALAASTRLAYEMAASRGKPRVLFSAHGLPEKIVSAGDPYPMQCERTMQALTQTLAIPGLDGVLCYQSRVGPLKWIGPATDDEIRRAGRDKVPVVVVPIAFVSEHSETLVELDIEYRHLAEQAGIPFYARVPAVGIAPDFINGLAGIVRDTLSRAQDSGRDCVSASGGRICGASYSGCPVKP